MANQIEAFGKYLLLERVAAGGMAEVYLAKSTGANGVSKFLAIKRILPQFSDRTEYVEMFKDEAKIAVNLNHSNVVSIYDFGIEKKQFFIVMEYVEGKNLRQIINELKKLGVHFTIEQIVFMIKEVAAGLDHAHRCIDGSTGKPLNIIHRDMSPQNIMVSYEGEIKVIDFGIAKASNQLEGTKPGELKGKYGYMSPEQSEGTDLDIRTDIFSLGIVLWELLANDRLFTANNEAAILRKIRECQVPPIRKINPSVPIELEKIVHKALAKDINLRYQSTAQFHRDLNRFLNTKFPDFSAQDFSLFVKNTFKTAFSDSKKRLVQYSTLRHSDPEKTGVTRTMTQTGTDRNSADQNISNQATVIHVAPGLPAGPTLAPQEAPIFEGGTLDFNKSAKIDLRKLKGESAAAQQKAKIQGLSQHTMTKRITLQRTGVSTDEVTLWVLRALILAFVITGTYFTFDYFKRNDPKVFAKKYLPKPVYSIIFPPPLPKIVEHNQPVEGSTEMASKISLYKVTITSNPPGARIYIDDEDKMALTPYQLELEAKKTYVLSLKKEGYHPQATKINTERNPTTLKFNLIAMAESGYLSIYVINGGTDPIIEVDGVRILQPPPVEKLAINSNVPVRISARNPFTNLTDEVTVVVQPRTRKIVELIPGRNSGSTNNKVTLPHKNDKVGNGKHRP